MAELAELLMALLERWACPAGVVAAAFDRAATRSYLRLNYEHGGTVAW